MRSSRMHRACSRLHREEDGIAMVIAMMVVFVVVLLSIVVFDMSIHNTDQAAYDRKRVTSIAAAEAGVDRAWNLVQYTAPQSLPCGTTVTGTLGSEPGPATYSISFTWYKDSIGTAFACTSTDRPTQSVPPVAALITAIGETNTGVPRTMQTYVTLSPNYGGFGSAILAVTNTTFSNNFGILGASGNDGNIYVTDGNLVIDNAISVSGNIYVHNGTASMKNNGQINGELWANGSVTLLNPSAVGTNVISSTGSITGGSNGGTIGGFAMAGTTVAEPPLTVSGTTYEYSPQGAPPTQAFPKLCEVAISGVCSAMPWTGYTVTTVTSCTAAQTFLDATLTTPKVLWIPSGCADLQIANNDVFNFNDSLAIVTNGKITMANRNTWNGVTGKKLFFISNYRTGLVCSTGNYNITTGNNSNFKNASVLFYSPCTVSLNNQNDFTGQVLGNSVQILNHFTMQYQPVLVPGLDSVTGFNQNVVYIREVDQ